MTLEEMIEAHAKGEFDKFRKLGSGSMVGVMVKSDGDHKYTSGACHANVKYLISRDSLGFITFTNPEVVGLPGAALYYDWLINRSAFSGAFLCKDVQTNLRHGFLKRLDYNAAAWLGAAQLSRLSTGEYRDSMKAVYATLENDHKIHPMLLTVALGGGMATYENNQIRLGLSAAESLFENGGSSYTHLPFKTFRGEEDFKSVCEDRPEKIDPTPENWLCRKAGWPYNSSSVLYAKKTPSSYSQRLRSIAKQLYEGFPTTFGLTTVLEEGPYEDLWEAATTKLKRRVFTTTTDKQVVPINLGPLEELTRVLNLGAPFEQA